MTENNKNNTESTESTPNPSKRGKDFGMYMYPDRVDKNEFSFFEKAFQKTFDPEYCRFMCENGVKEAFKKHPLLRLLKGALENAGCPLDLKRHVICESCSTRVQGGYDHEFNQIVLCKNITKVREHPEVILLHELIHMYDNCVNEINFHNLEHLACTEIRAANLAHCSFFSSVLLGESSPISIKKTHQYCVKKKAIQSLMVARNLDFTTALRHVLKVFDKCYNDLEPVGRRIRRNSQESFMAEEEAKCYLIT